MRTAAGAWWSRPIVRGRDLGGFVTDAQAAVAELALPVGYRLDWGGQFENLKRAEQRLGLVIPSSSS